MNTIIIAVFIFSFSVGNLISQPKYKIHISDIKRNVHKNLLQIPTTVDYTVRWELLHKEQGQQNFVPTSFTDIQPYQVLCSASDSTFSKATVNSVTRQDSLVFTGMEIGKKYYFKIQGKTTDNRLFQSEPAWMLTGKESNIASAISTQEENESSKGILNVFNKSTIWGKAAFVLITFFFIVGFFFISCYRCTKFIRLGKVFPVRRFSLFSFRGFGFERSYESRVSPKLRFIIEAWKKVMQRSSSTIKETESVEAASKKVYADWKNSGVSSIETLEDIIKYDPTTDTDGKMKEQIQNDINTHFGELKGNTLEMDSANGKIETPWQEVDEHLYHTKNAKKFGAFPTIKIISAGLSNHKINGYRWLEASDEVDRAIENRASSELDRLKRRSGLDWLWNFGATAPLVGLFGTVTGITVAFKELRELPPGTTHLEIINKLSGGIFEALWTTIFGLIVGIILIQLYYYYKNKLDWIYSKWEQIYVNISEKL